MNLEPLRRVLRADILDMSPSCGVADPRRAATAHQPLSASTYSMMSPG